MKFVRLLLYFVLVVLIGGLGCWISLGQHYYNPGQFTIFSFVSNLGTFSISVAVMAFADFLLVSANSYSSARGLFLLVIMALAVIASATGLILQELFMVKVAWISFGLSLFQWWLVQWRNPSFDETVDPLTSLGGSVQ